MAQLELETMKVFSKRSDSTVMQITYSFALGGAVMEIFGTMLPGILNTKVGFPMLWGMWIPLCFITIPPIHYLCRQMQAMQKRIDDLESQLKPAAHS